VGEDEAVKSSAPPVIAIVGATATGKSDLAVRLALALNAEVVNADSMQLYRGMDIGTAKLSHEERHGVPHHLLDVWDVLQTASVAEYQKLARKTFEQIHARGRRAVLVGGSGLYVRAALDVMEFPGTDPDARARLEQRLAEIGPVALHRELALADPDAAASILPSNGRRIVRALEVVEMHGSYTASLPSHEYAVPAVQIGLVLDREGLDATIDARVTRMWEAGFVDEVRSLEALGLREGVTASRAIGYAQVLAQLDGRLTEVEARERTAQVTRRFARRQESWFSRDPRIRWMKPDGIDVAELADELRGAVVDTA
jgi:tRNA dimethylallyltransferase